MELLINANLEQHTFSSIVSTLISNANYKQQARQQSIILTMERVQTIVFSIEKSDPDFETDKDCATATKAAMEEQTKSFTNGTNIKFITFSEAISSLETVVMDPKLLSNEPTAPAATQAISTMSNGMADRPKWPRINERYDKNWRERQFVNRRNNGGHKSPIIRE